MDQLPNSNKSDDNDVRHNENHPPRTPKWVKISGIIVIVLVLLFVIKVLIFGGEHGPGRHFPSGEPAQQIEQVSLEDHSSSNSHRTPKGGHS